MKRILLMMFSLLLVVGLTTVSGFHRIDAEETVSYEEGSDQNDPYLIYDSEFTVTFGNDFIVQNVIGIFFDWDSSDRHENVINYEEAGASASVDLDNNTVNVVSELDPGSFVLVVNNSSGDERSFWFTIPEYTFEVEGEKYIVKYAILDSNNDLVYTDRDSFKQTGEDIHHSLIVAVLQYDRNHSPAPEEIRNLVYNGMMFIEDVPSDILPYIKNVVINDTNSIYAGTEYGDTFQVISFDIPKDFCGKTGFYLRCPGIRLLNSVSYDLQVDSQVPEGSDHFDVDDLTSGGPAQDIARLNEILSSRESFAQFAGAVVESLDEENPFNFYFSQKTVYPGLIHVNCQFPIAFCTKDLPEIYDQLQFCYYYDYGFGIVYVDEEGYEEYEPVYRAYIKGGIVNNGGLVRVSSIRFESDPAMTAAYNNSRVTVGIMTDLSNEESAFDLSNVLNCSFDGYDYGLLSYENGMISGINLCLFENNGVAISYDSLSYDYMTYSDSNIFSNNDIAVEYVRLPESYETEQVCIFYSSYFGNNADFKIACDGIFLADDSYYGEEYEQKYTNDNVRDPKVIYAEGTKGKMLTGPFVRYPEEGEMVYGFDETPGAYNYVLNNDKYPRTVNFDQFRHLSNDVDIIIYEAKQEDYMPDMIIDYNTELGKIRFKADNDQNPDAQPLGTGEMSICIQEDEYGGWLVNLERSGLIAYLDKLKPVIDVNCGYTGSVVLYDDAGSLEQVPYTNVGASGTGCISFTADRNTCYWLLDFDKKDSLIFELPNEVANIIYNEGNALELELPTDFEHPYVSVYFEDTRPRHSGYDILEENSDYRYDPESGTVSFTIDPSNGLLMGKFFIMNEPAMPVLMRYSSLTDNGQIGVNFKMYFPDHLVQYNEEDGTYGDGTFVRLTHIKKKSEQQVSRIVIEKTVPEMIDYMRDELGINYQSNPEIIFSLPMAVKELGDDLIVEVFTHYQIDPVTKEVSYLDEPIRPSMYNYYGEKIDEEGLEYNTLDLYVDRLVENTAQSEGLRQMCTALHNYVNAAQIFFEYNNENSTIVQEPIDAVRIEDLEGFRAELITARPENFGLTHSSVRLVLEDQTQSIHYFKLDGAVSINDYQFDVEYVHDITGDTEIFENIAEHPEYKDRIELYETKDDNGDILYALRFNNIPAPELTDKYTITITKKGSAEGENTYAFKYCPLSYAYRVIELYGDSTDEKMKQLNVFVKALYNYCVASYHYYYEEKL